MVRRVLVAGVVALALAACATSSAAKGYRIYDAAWHRPPVGSLFSVNVHGFAARKALVYLYLDRRPCRLTWAKESRLDVEPFTAGQSYFRETGRALIKLRVSGRFNVSPTAHAGSTAEREYACAYLTTPNPHGPYRLTAAHASNTYYVTG